VALLCSESWTTARPRRLGSENPIQQCHTPDWFPLRHSTASRLDSTSRDAYIIAHGSGDTGGSGGVEVAAVVTKAPELPRPVYNANVLVNHVSPRTHNERGGTLSGENTRSSLPQTRLRVSRWYIIYTFIYIYI
jgi:hypothetical protein